MHVALEPTDAVSREQLVVEQAASRQPSHRPERGLAAVWLVLTAVVLLGAAAFAIDQSFWLYEGQRQQKAVDLASMAGVVFLPDNPIEAAEVARAALEANGFDPANATFTPGSGQTGNQLRVRLVENKQSFFGRVLGVGGVGVGRAATADYVAPLGLGSPSNQLGNDPESGGAQPNFWLRQFGSVNFKHNGDRFGTQNCSPDLSTNVSTVHGCSSTATSGANVDYNTVGVRGYRYQVRAITVPAGADLVIEAFDPIVTATDPCEGALPDAAGRAALAAWVPDAATRFLRKSEGGVGWCGSDQYGLSGDPNPPPIPTEFVVQELTTEGGVGATVCTHVASSYRLTPGGSGAESGTVAQLINPNDLVEDNGVTRTPYAEEFFTSFRKWKPLCRIPAVTAGAYIVTVRMNTTANGGGANGFSLRAVYEMPVTFARNGAGVVLSAVENFPVYINDGAATSQLYMTRLRPFHAGRTLTVRLYDMGDTSAGSVNVQLLPPTDSNVGGSWPCAIKAESTVPIATPGANTANCSLSGMTRTDYNGTLVTFDVPIPANFTCNEADPNGCWTKIQVTHSGGSQPTDQTTWSAVISGSPVRLRS